MNILITGSHGFIGNAFIQYLATKKEFSLFTISNSKEYRRKGQDFFLNLTNKELLQSLLKELQTTHIDVLFHFAGITPFNNRFDFETDNKMAESITVLCNSLAIPKLVYISGWIVYDKTSRIPIKETAQTNPSTEYGQSKLFVEQYFKKNLSRSAFINLRLASVFGPGQTIAGLIPNLVKSAYEQQEITVDNPQIKRDYLYIDNALIAFEKLMKITKMKSVDLNIGSGKSYARGAIAENIQKIFQDVYKQTIKITEKENINSDGMQDNRMSIELSEKFLGEYNQIDLDEGLRRYIDSFIRSY